MQISNSSPIPNAEYLVKWNDYPALVEGFRVILWLRHIVGAKYQLGIIGEVKGILVLAFSLNRPTGRHNLECPRLLHILLIDVIKQIRQLAVQVSHPEAIAVKVMQ